ncbi:MAG: 2-amino-4-hydroxy-6-hydroxymethyldihydropteridine diphosphokinase [Planctomycetaceae bacterium]
MPESAVHMHRAYLALGSNIEPEKNLVEAIRRLARSGTTLAVSRIYQTAPVGPPGQPDYLNAAVLLETPASLAEVRERIIPEIERALGRVRVPGNKHAPRTIDVDVALFDREVIDADDCRIPDPDILERPFLAITLAELDPEYVHPQDDRTLREIATSFPPESRAMRVRDDVMPSEFL